MSFTSYIFIGFLILLFLVYYLIPKKFQWMLLLGASYVFYAFAGWSCLVYIAVTTVATYFSTFFIDNLYKEQSAYLKANKAGMTSDEKKAYKKSMDKKRNVWLALGLTILLGMLVVIKYTNFAVMSINSIGSLFGNEKVLDLPNLILPLGISFYVFQSAGYVIDVWRKKYPAERNFAKLALFVSFFPQLIQGPISRFDDLAVSLYAPHEFSGRNLSFGMQRILWGFFKKLVIADRLAPAVKVLIEDSGEMGGFYVVALMVFYAAQLYADFTGGIDITIGIAQVLGIELKENFDRPYLSKDIEEYWRRWHITMGTWFRDYIFYPLSVCKTMLKISKWSNEKFGRNIGKRVPVYIATMLTWLATGLWHSQYTYWNFIVWGLLNGVIIIISQEFKPLYEKFHEKCGFSNSKGWGFFMIVRTFFLMSALRLFDCYRDVGATFKNFFSIFWKFNWGALFDGSMLKLNITSADYIIVGIGIAAMIAVSLLKGKEPVRERIAKGGYAAQIAVCFVLFFATLILGAYGEGYDASSFIYNQF